MEYLRENRGIIFFILSTVDWDKLCHKIVTHRYWKVRIHPAPQKLTGLAWLGEVCEFSFYILHEFISIFSDIFPDASHCMHFFYFPYWRKA